MLPIARALRLADSHRRQQQSYEAKEKAHQDLKHKSTQIKVGTIHLTEKISEEAVAAPFTP